MATIDTRALQAFYELWAPVLDSLPAVINAARHEAELQQSINAKQAQFQALENSAAEKQAQYDQRLKSLEGRIGQAKADQATALKAIEEEVVVARAKASAAKQEAAAQVAQAAAQVEQVQAQTQAARFEHERTLAKFAEAAKARQAELNAEIAALEQKRAAVLDSIKALRAQLVA